jgi:zinc transport system substrate-binding protein
LDPGNGSTYAANYAAFAAELDSLDREIRARLAGVANRRFMVNMGSMMGMGGM